MPITWPLVPYSAFVPSPPVIPKMYWDVYSQEQRWKEICCTIEKITQYIESQAGAENELKSLIDDLQKQFDEFKESGFDDYYYENILNWINKNIERLLAPMVERVYFGLTEDGYFVAYIPESWNEIVFDTGADYSKDTYGRLILRWEVTPQQALEAPTDQTDLDERRS